MGPQWRAQWSEEQGSTKIKWEGKQETEEGRKEGHERRKEKAETNREKEEEENRSGVW